jgi:hypothetical protein
MLKFLFNLFAPKKPAPKLKLNDKIQLKHPKNVLIVQGENSLWEGTIQPEYILTVFRVDDSHTLFRVAKNGVKTDKLKKGDLVTISNDSLINLEYKKL